MAVVWLAATAAALVAAWKTKAGPVVAVLSMRHGIHGGDVVAFAAAYAVATSVTVALLAPLVRDRRRRAGGA